MDKLFFGLSFGLAIATGLVSGIFYGFSSFVMPALGRMPAPQGIAAMQSINVTVITPSFLILFMGSALASVAAIILSIVRWGTPGALQTIIGSLAYVIGTFGWTVVFHLPKNDALSELPAESAEAAAFWERFLPVWTAGNTFRTAAAAVAMAAFILAVIDMRQAH